MITPPKAAKDDALAARAKDGQDPGLRPSARQRGVAPLQSLVSKGREAFGRVWDRVPTCKSLSIFVHYRRVVFEGFPVDFDGPVDPLFVIFAQEPVAAHDVAFQKAVAVHGELHVLGR
jgi:hypothetical protein